MTNDGIRFFAPKLLTVSMTLIWMTPLTSAFAHVAKSRGGTVRCISSFAATKENSSPLHYYRKFSSETIRKAQNSDSLATKSSDEDIPLVFLHGMKGSHLSFPTGADDGQLQRAWLSLGGLLNFPPREDGHPERDISMPLSYTQNDESTSFAVQDRGRHVVDGTVDHVVELSGVLPSNSGPLLSNRENLDFFPFYGQATKFLEKVNEAYIQSGDKSGDGDGDGDGPGPTSTTLSNGRTVESIMKPRPTRTFAYDWRRNLFELAEEFHEFCEKEFPNGQPVQIMAHSMGGLLAYAVMKEHPEKYAPGGVLVGVPFGTGIQYFQDMHKGYFSELGTCRQFLPPAQFTFSSHWSFFPMDREEIGESFVDVSEYFEGKDSGDDIKIGQPTIAFEADRSTIGKQTAEGQKEEKWRPATPGKPIEIDFYDPDEWEKNEIGIFDPFYRAMIEAADKEKISEYKKHMALQMKDAKRWRTTVLAPWEDEVKARNHMPPLTICSTISVPTPNQILRRKRRIAPSGGAGGFPRSLVSLLETGDESSGDQKHCRWEYDYASGRTVPGDGRINYDGSFPPSGTSFSTVDLDSLHAKQFCWEENGGDLGKLLDQVNQQLEDYQKTTARKTDRSLVLETTR